MKPKIEPQAIPFIRLPQQNHYREYRCGEWGYFLADLDSKTIHVSNALASGKIESFTTQDFGVFCVESQRLFKGDELIRIIEIGLRVHQNFWAGTY